MMLVVALVLGLAAPALAYTRTNYGAGSNCPSGWVTRVRVAVANYDSSLDDNRFHIEHRTAYHGWHGWYWNPPNFGSTNTYEANTSHEDISESRGRLTNLSWGEYLDSAVYNPEVICSTS